MARTIFGEFRILANSGQAKYKILDIVEIIPASELSIERIQRDLKNAGFQVKVSFEEEIYTIDQERDQCPKCKKKGMEFSNYCGVMKCVYCDYHHKLSKCFCGWNVRDTQDRIEVGMDEDATFDGNSWEVRY